jgi:hypothetical protein
LFSQIILFLGGGDFVQTAEMRQQIKDFYGSADWAAFDEQTYAVVPKRFLDGSHHDHFGTGTEEDILTQAAGRVPMYYGGNLRPQPVNDGAAQHVMDELFNDVALQNSGGAYCSRRHVA